jgi:DNA-binding transcriptional MocR family regulator
MSALQTTQLNIPEGMIDFGVGQPSLSLLPLEALRKAADHRLSQGNAELLAYGSDQGDGYFRNTLSQFLSQRYRVPVNPDHLMVTAGASQAIDLICTRFTKPGDTIFVEEPTYFLALLIFRDHGLNVVGIPMDAHGLRMDALEDALTRHRPVLLYTIPTFQNPSAITLPAERRERLVALSRQHDFLIVADEVYHLLDFGEAPPHPLAAHSETGRVLSLGSFSKLSAPGLRLGWVQAAPALLDRLIAAGLLESGGGLNPFTSKIMHSMLELGLQDACLDRLRGVYRERCAVLSNALREHLPAAAFVEPRGGFFIWLQLPAGRTAPDILEDAQRHGVNFQSGTRFASGGALANYVRLSFAHYEPGELVEGVMRLAQVLR